MKSNRVLKEMKADLVERYISVVVVLSDAAWANRGDLPSTLGFFSGVTAGRILKGGGHVVTPIHHRLGKVKRKARSRDSNMQNFWFLSEFQQRG